MSRSYSKARFEEAVKKRWYDSVKYGRYKYRDATYEEMVNQAKVNASKSQRGAYSAPSWFVQLYFNRPMRRAEKAMIEKVLSGKIDADDAAYPVYRKGAWWLWW